MDLNWRIIKSNEQSREEIRKIQRSKYSQEKECIYCHEKFDYGYSSLKSCLACKIIVKCCICNKEFELNFNRFSGADQNRINKAILNKENLCLTCSKECKHKLQGITYSQYCKENPDKIKEQCKAKFDPKTGHYFRGNSDLTLRAKLMREKCKEIEDNNPEIKKEHRSKCIQKAREYWINNPELARQNAINNIKKWNNSEEGRKANVEHCKKLGKEWGSKICSILNERHEEYCKKCKCITLHNGFNNCIICNPVATKPNFTTKNKVRYYKDKELNQLCKDLLSGKEDINNYPGFDIRLGRVCYNRKDVLTDETIFLNQNFQIKDNVKYYRNESVEKIIQKLNSGEYNINNFPGWNKRFGEWYYNSENILTGEITKLNGSLFYEKDKELYYFDKELGDYVPWDKYKEKFLISSRNIELPEEFEIIPTFRKQNSDTWEGSKSAFEQLLLDLNIDWFIYIKFYINNEGKSVPLVCGKSGSLNVNVDGSDVSFSTDINDGPARRFLAENNFEWDKTKIAILKCDSEKEAYLAEQYNIRKYNLFES